MAKIFIRFVAFNVFTFFTDFFVAFLFQLHPFKPGSATGGIQTLTNTVTLAQVLPNRTQTLVYSGGNSAHFTSTPRITVASSLTTQRQGITTRPAVSNLTLINLIIKLNQ